MVARLAPGPRLVTVLLPALLAAQPSMAAADESSDGLLVVGGGESSAAALRAALAGTPGARLLQADQVRQRIRAVPAVSVALQRSHDKLVEAEQAELAMNRRAAVKAAEAALQLLESVRAQLHAPTLEAEALCGLGLALLLRPAERAAALRAFRRAFALVPDHQVNPDRVPPPAAALLESARRQPVPLERPSAAALSWLASQARLRRLLWVGVGQGQVEVVLFDAGRSALSAAVRRPVPPAESVRVAAAMIDQALMAPASGGPAAAAAGMPALTGSPPRSASTGSGDRAPRWYRRWWVWSLVGAVVVGTGIGVTLSVTRDSGAAHPSSGYEFRFHL